jgi:hypothetical protein
MSLIQSPGKYAATVASAEFGESEKGTPFLKIDFNTDQGESISGWLYLSEKALPGSLRTLREAFEFDGNFETVVDQITGKPCSITCENEEYDGKERIKVKWINSPRSSKPIDNQESFLKALSAKAARLPKEAPRAGSAPTKTPPPAKAPVRSGAKTSTEDGPF